jgi:hypothetical protein
MRRAAVLAVSALLALARLAVAGPEGCGVCHGTERTRFEASVHRSAEFGCTTCHGGDPATVASKEAAHSVEKGFRRAVTRREVADACGTCHADVARMRPFGLRTDALAAYRTSHHGKSMAAGRDDAATCSDCHGVHDVRRVADEASPAHRANVPATCGRCHGDAAMMARHDVRTHAVEDFARSVHGTRLERGDAGVPTCADCHDAHAAAPPGAAEVADVCGACHVETRDRFRESPHAAASKAGRMRQCVTCHGNHAVSHPDHGLFDAASDAAPAERAGTRCLSCHDGSDPEDAGARVARQIGRSLRAVEADLNGAASRVEVLAAQGFRVAAERESLERARIELARALPLAHTVDVARIDGALRHVRSLVRVALDGCDGKVRESRDRRIYGSAAGGLLLLASTFLVLRGRRVRR